MKTFRHYVEDLFYVHKYIPDDLECGFSRNMTFLQNSTQNAKSAFLDTLEIFVRHAGSCLELFVVTG